MSSSDRRFATDGSEYTYADFVEWYDAHANQMWESAAATEHSESSPVAIDALPALEQQAAFNVSSVLVLSCNVGSSICSELQVRSVREVKRR